MRPDGGPRSGAPSTILVIVSWACGKLGLCLGCAWGGLELMMSLVLTGTATGLLEQTYKREDGSEGVMRKAVVLNDRGTNVIQVVLTKDVPSPGQGEVVSYEVGVSGSEYKGRVYINYTAYRLAALPAI